MKFRDSGIKRTIAILTLVFCAFTSGAQDLNPVKWTFFFNQDLGMLEFHAEIGEGWHLYATELESDEGPLPTEFVFETEVNLKIEKDSVVELKAQDKYDPNFDMNIRYFEDETVFKYKVGKIDDTKVANTSGYVSFMVCNDEKCLPPEDVEFKITVE